jgi:hypothetical protein
MVRLRTAWLCALASGAPLFAQAWQSETVDPQAEALAFRQLTVDGRDNTRAVRKLVRELDWHTSLDTATAEAAATGKPIFWVQAVGKLKGFT